MNKRKRKNKTVIIGLGILALLALGSAAYVKSSQLASNKAPNQEQAEPKDAEFDPKTDSEAAQRNAEAASASTTPATPSSASASTLAKPTITRAEQGSDGAVSVAAIVGQTRTGTCTAVFTKGQATFSRTTSVIQATNYYACGEFRVAKSDFPALGEWEVKVVLSSNNANAASDTLKFQVN